ncbi:hypothetical protein NCAS_0E02500 [Naumovozyma castellii]|uniref:Phosphatidic acid phosphatase type 2/haloperoxidase domain-containing protein n=1 Tax=Naumovozyma castellii TaxID=27288 RepID=G0VFQ3_NAUCA|nr:hypothetical protein NCAS_0E02500 [Naumovozyma castellii CBS 4309]CCC70320.1 hypothetical protein NCAS_0E02500 [Naumovozyma castellii CBS 4309]
MVVALFRKWFLSQRPTNCHLADLDTRWNPRIGIRRLKSYQPTRYDYLHYGFMGSVWLFVLITNPAPFILKLIFYSLLILLFLIPITSQFFFNALPILTWLSLYFTSSYFPAESRPPITVKVLPTIETMLYGDNLSDILATSTNKILDVLAWIPYGVFHFGAPFVVAFILFIFGPPTILHGFSFAFGYMNLIGVMIQNVFPAAPPWYKILYGLQSANYSMKGSPGGLARIDKLLHIDVYTKGFSNSSVIFGAFPSLHSGCATMLALFFAYCFPRGKNIFIAYVCWLWWSTMYLTHHYFVDLIIGSVLSFVIFQYTKYYMLPIVDTDLFCRWSYSELSKYDVKFNDPLNVGGIDDVESVPLNEIDVRSQSNDSAASVTPSIFDKEVRFSRSNATSTTSLGSNVDFAAKSNPRLNGSGKRAD